MKTYVKVCEECDEIFTTTYKGKLYCSKSCRISAIRSKMEENSQPCWRCQNACGGCSWSKNLTPVDGWKAEQVDVKDKEGVIRTYKITFCPQFIQD